MTPKHRLAVVHVALAAFVSMAQQARGTLIFEDGFESGDTSSWSAEHPSCDVYPQPVPGFPGGLLLLTEWGSVAELEVRTRNIWAVWWHPQFDHEADAQALLDQLDDIRCRSINDLQMQDPPNPGCGFFYNVYIHHGDDDDFPAGWGNGQGTDGYGNPYLTLPASAVDDIGNTNHEGFHVFQYSGDSPGFAYSGDSQWYVESSAQWYAASREPAGVMSFIEAGAIDGNPHLSLWHSFGNGEPGDPEDWLFLVRQYGMHTYLFFMTHVAGVPNSLVTSGFYGGVTELPQEYHHNEVGGDTLRSLFADWAAQNTADFDYLTPEQVARARLEVELVGDPANLHPHVAEYFDEGTGGAWTRPPAELTARTWAYNVVKINNTQARTYAFELQGDAAGSEGAASHFEGRVVVLTPMGAEYKDLDMVDALHGSAEVEVDAADAEVFLVVVSAPEHFTGNQTFSYEYRIE